MLGLIIGGRKFTFKWIERDNIWGKYDKTYTAILSPNDPSYNIGDIDPSIFTGLAPHYYIEIHLKIT